MGTKKKVVKKRKKALSLRTQMKHLRMQLTEAEDAARLQLRRASTAELELSMLRRSEFVWQTGDGRCLKPLDMDESHLRNTISYLQRRLVHEFGTAKWLQRTATHVEALHEMLKEASRRGIKV